MPSSPLGSTHSRTTSGVACHHRLWAAQTDEQRRAWHPIITFGLAHKVGQHRDLHAIISLGRQTRLNDFGRAMPSSRLGSTRSNDVWQGMTSPPLDCTHGRQRRPWHDITALGQHTQSATSRVAWHHRPLTEHTVGNVGRGMPSWPLGSTHG